MDNSIPTRFTGQVCESGERVIEFITFDDIKGEWLEAYNNTTATSPEVTDETLAKIDWLLAGKPEVKDGQDTDVAQLESMVNGFLESTTGSGDYQINTMTNSNAYTKFS